MATHSNTFPGQSHGQRRPVDYSPWGHKDEHKLKCVPIDHIFIFIRNNVR